MPVSSTRADARTEATAIMLMEEHAAGKQFWNFAAKRGIRDVADAYRVQEALVRRMMSTGNSDAAGFKIGLTSKKMQEMCRIDTPVAGYVLDNRVHASGVALEANRYRHLGLEFEIAVKMGADLPFRLKTYTQEEVAAAVAAVAPGIELVDDRLADYANLEVLSLIADNSWNAGVVLGAWQAPVADLADCEGVVLRGRKTIGQGFGRDVLGHPYVPLTWLANHRAKSDRPLKKGDVVMTGSIVRTQFPEASCSYHYDLTGLGSVEVTVTV
jgi:2-keto-4-pentenoate hydratase